MVHLILYGPYSMDHKVWFYKYLYNLYFKTCRAQKQTRDFIERSFDELKELKKKLENSFEDLKSEKDLMMVKFESERTEWEHSNDLLKNGEKFF